MSPPDRIPSSKPPTASNAARRTSTFPAGVASRPSRPWSTLRKDRDLAYLGSQASLSRVADDQAGDRPAVVRDRLGEVGVQEPGGRGAIGVHEQEPAVGRRLARPRCGRGRRSAPHSPATIRTALAGYLRDRSSRGVVGDDQLVTALVASQRDSAPSIRSASPRPPRNGTTTLTGGLGGRSSRSNVPRYLSQHSGTFVARTSRWASRGRRRTPSRRCAGARRTGAAARCRRPRPRTGS